MNLHEFHLIRPWALLLLTPLALLPLLQWARRSDGGNGWSRICDVTLLPHLLRQFSDSRESRHARAIAVSAWTLAVLALAGPTWERAPEAAFRAAEPVVIALELASSMDTTDVAPSRMERARQELKDALSHLDGGPVGLVIYAEEPYVAVPVTDDVGVISTLLPTLATNLMPGRGCRPDRAIDASLELLKHAGPGGRILLIADGDGDAKDLALASAKKARDEGVVVAVLGVGEPMSDEQARRSATMLDVESMRSVANAGGGEFALAIHGDRDLERVVPKQDPNDAPQLASTFVADRWRDLGPFLLIPVVALASLLFRRGLGLVALLLTFSLPARDASADVVDPFLRPDQRGARAMEAGRPDEAAKEFVDPAWKAAALYRAGDYEAAARTLSERTDAESRYNRGNALARLGQLEEAKKCYESALAERSDHADARHNLEIINRLLEQQDQKDQQQPQDPKDQTGEQDPKDQTGQQDPKDQTGQQDPKDQTGQQDPNDPQDQLGEQDPKDQTGQRDPKDQPGEPVQKNAPDPQGQPDRQNPKQDRVDSKEDPNQELGAEPERSDAPNTATPLSESDQAREHWLGRVPDDPGRLLREKLRRRYEANHYGRRN